MTLRWNTLSCIHISVEISGRSLRALVRAASRQAGMLLGLPASSR